MNGTAELDERTCTYFPNLHGTKVITYTFSILSLALVSFRSDAFLVAVLAVVALVAIHNQAIIRTLLIISSYLQFLQVPYYFLLLIKF